ncbi:GNAT family N-acetyltransferase [Phytohalomonas tamaricis]|uniref:GNAT family N-acetyltransferase n=1 Tax=Phytohalomonas tamaricis TaxID=2081032 RepID=UPI0021D42AD8|nr:GNAT family N-acetyltransferase [Phytohalomonas tamaricis]
MTDACGDAMKIVRLTPDHPALPVIAQWHFTQWGHLRANDSEAAVLERLCAACTSTAVPSTYVALYGETPVGTARLIEYDMPDMPRRTPWLAAVIVAPKYRRRGIASRLVRHVEQVAFAAGYVALYLYTPDQQRLYARLGWQQLEEDDYRGQRVTVMRQLAPHLEAKRQAAG